VAREGIEPPDTRMTLAFQCAVPGSDAPQHFLYFFPLPHEHGSLRPTFGSGRTYVSG
jgi:hypothetical protein